MGGNGFSSTFKYYSKAIQRHIFFRNCFMLSTNFLIGVMIVAIFRVQVIDCCAP